MELNPETNRYRKKCPPTHERNEHGICIRKCRPDEDRVASTGRCAKKCKPGYEKNDDGRCVKSCIPPRVKHPITKRCRDPRNTSAANPAPVGPVTRVKVPVGSGCKKPRCHKTKKGTCIQPNPWIMFQVRNKDKNMTMVEMKEAYATWKVENEGNDGNDDDNNGGGSGGNNRRARKRASRPTRPTVRPPVRQNQNIPPIDPTGTLEEIELRRVARIVQLNNQINQQTSESSRREAEARKADELRKAAQLRKELEQQAASRNEMGKEDQNVDDKPEEKEDEGNVSEIDLDLDDDEDVEEETFDQIQARISENRLRDAEKARKEAEEKRINAEKAALEAIRVQKAVVELARKQKQAYEAKKELDRIQNLAKEAEAKDDDDDDDDDVDDESDIGEIFGDGNSDDLINDAKSLYENSMKELSVLKDNTKKFKKHLEEMKNNNSVSSRRVERYERKLDMRMKAINNAEKILEDLSSNNMIKEIHEQVVHLDGAEEYLKNPKGKNPCKILAKLLGLSSTGYVPVFRLSSGKDHIVYYAVSENDDGQYVIRVGRVEGDDKPKSSIGKYNIMYSNKIAEDIRSKIEFVPRLFHHSEDNNIRTQVTTYAQGTSLDKYLEKILLKIRDGSSNEKKESMKNLQNVICRYAKTLRYMHGNMFTHGDAHVGNMIVSSEQHQEMLIPIDIDRSVQTNREDTYQLGNTRQSIRDTLNKYDLTMALSSLFTSVYNIFMRDGFATEEDFNGLISDIYKKFSICYNRDEKLWTHLDLVNLSNIKNMDIFLNKAYTVYFQLGIKRAMDLMVHRQRSGVSSPSASRSAPRKKPYYISQQTGDVLALDDSLDSGYEFIQEFADAGRDDKCVYDSDSDSD